MYGREDGEEFVTHSRFRYPAECDPLCDPQLLCISHKKRMRANTIQNNILAPAGATRLSLPEDFDELTGTTMQPQDMKIWASSDGVKLDGITLIGCPRGSGKQFVVQGVLYCVMKIAEGEIELQMLTDCCHGSKDEKITVPIEEVCLQLRMSHAICYYTIQGRTIRDRHIVLLDTVIEREVY